MRYPQDFRWDLDVSGHGPVMKNAQALVLHFCVYSSRGKCTLMAQLLRILGDPVNATSGFNLCYQSNRKWAESTLKKKLLHGWVIQDIHFTG